MGRIRTINKLLKIFPSIKNIYDHIITAEPKLKDKIRFRRLRATEEYLIFYEDVYFELLSTTLLHLEINFVDEQMNSFVVSNIPLESDENLLVPLLNTTIGNYYYIDYFSKRQDARSRSARIHVPVGYWETDIGRQLELELKPYDDGFKPFIKLPCPPPYSNTLYLRLYIPDLKPNRMKAKKAHQQQQKQNQNENEPISKVNEERKLKYTENKDTNENMNVNQESGKTKIEILIEQNEIILRRSKEQGEFIRAEFKKVNTKIENLNLLVGQMFKQMHLIDENLLTLLTDKTISTNKKLESVNRNVLLTNIIEEEENQEKKEKMSTEEAELERKNILQKQLMAENMPLPESPEIDRDQEQKMEIEKNYQNRKRAHTGTLSPIHVKKQTVTQTTKDEKQKLKLVDGKASRTLMTFKLNHIIKEKTKL